MKLLHLSFDIPDEFEANKTVAIKNLIDSSINLKHENYYISMNRTNDIKSKISKIKSSNHISIKMFGFPLGIGLIQLLKKFYKQILDSELDINKYDIIHAHKLTYEGYIANLLYKEYNKPYVISIRFTDFKILKIRKELIYRYKEVLLNSKKIFCIAPWMKNELKSLFGEEFINGIEEKIEVLPNIIKNEMYELKHTHNNKFVTIFKVTKKNIKRKNIIKTLECIKIINDSGEQVLLDIIGSGNGIKVLEKYIKKNKLEQYVNLIGSMPNEDVLKKLTEYKGFIMCSYPETFGLVYIEALIKGIPIIYTKNAGIDGFFDDYNVGISVDYKKNKSIIDSILDVNKNYLLYKEAINNMHKDGYLKIFTQNVVSNKYESCLEDILRKS